MELPKEFKERMKNMLGEEYPAFITSYDGSRTYGLRVNTLKITPEEFEQICPFPIQRIPWIKNGYFYREEDMPSKHPYYFAGLYYLQEPSAMTPASRLPVVPGEKVLDLCAAPGGKATELAALLKGEGILVANEISASRAKALLKNLELTGAVNTFITNEKPGSLSAMFESYFDKILVDAPCSGEGMFRKEPEVAKVWEENRPSFFAGIQKDILDQAVKMLKPGGMMLYSTCTFSKEENEGSISGLLQRHPQMQMCEMLPWDGFSKGLPQWGGGQLSLDKSVRIWPHKMQGEGHFMALLQKMGNDTEERKRRRKSVQNQQAVPKEKRKLLEQFLEHVAGKGFHEGLEIRGDKVYKVPDFGREIRGIKFLRNGLLMGEIKKNRFEPSQAFAMALKEEEFDSTLSLRAGDIRIEKYLKGEPIDVAPEETNRKAGWHLVCVDGFSLGWGKLVNGVLKNKYLSAWRKN
ncbi:MAG: RsmF rRNA methyltransferase first C-terminal domain-containing protein [Ruminococcus sp.]|jgi:NOL1/NOP2/sun family putative RNA methylase